MRLLDYIQNIETITDNQNEGEGFLIINFEVESSGLSGDGQGRCVFPPIDALVEGYQINWGEVEFSINAHSQNLSAGESEFSFSVEATGGGLNNGLAPFPIFEIYSTGRGGNSGECYFTFEVESEGNANREYELCT